MGPVFLLTCSHHGFFIFFVLFFTVGGQVTKSTVLKLYTLHWPHCAPHYVTANVEFDTFNKTIKGATLLFKKVSPSFFVW